MAAPTKGARKCHSHASEGDIRSSSERWDANSELVYPAGREDHTNENGSFGCSQNLDIRPDMNASIWEKRKESFSASV
jgi:hypothetical protein